MADPILGMRELTEGDPLGYLSQNDRNLVTARLLIPALKSGGTTGLTTPAGSEVRGDLFIVASSSATGSFAGKENHLAIAMSATPTSAGGFTFIALTAGIRVQDGVNSYVYNGSSWTAI